MAGRKRTVLKCIIGLSVLTALGGYALWKGSEMGRPQEAAETTAHVDTGFVLAGPGSFDSADTAVVVSKDDEKQEIIFQNMLLGKQYTLTYDGTTSIYDKYGETISMTQIQEGDVVSLTFLKGKKKLSSISISKDAWKLTDLSKYSIDDRNRHILVADDVYKYSDDTVIVSAGEPAEIMDINAADVLEIKGVGHNIYSIVVAKGHGYLRLKNDEYFVGGWIEIGQALIQEIKEDMLFVVPEGSYQVSVSNKGSGGVKKVQILRDQETELDIGDLKGEEVRQGTVLFTVSPEDAAIYIDGEQADISEPVLLEYGIHQMMAKADGYDTITQYIKVGQEAAGINVTMQKTADKTQNSVSQNSPEETEPVQLQEPETTETNEKPSADPAPSTDNTVSGNNNSNTTSTTTDGYKVYIDAPENAEIYLDGNYIGISPVSFKKSEGSHVVTLRRTGYRTRSYTISLDGEDKDVNYSFPELSASDGDE